MSDARSIANASLFGNNTLRQIELAQSYPTYAATLAIATLLAMFASLFLRASRFRTVRGWLLFTTIVSGWLCYGVAWQDMYWQGQQLRLHANLPAIEEFSQQLTNNWPTADGEALDAMTFLAYPRSAPRTLLVLGPAHFPKTELNFSAVESSPNGVLRYELAGSESGAWVELRPDGSLPQSFVGGMQTPYQMTQASRLSPQVFLVRYEESYKE